MFEPRSKLLDALANYATIALKLCLARATEPDAALLPFKVSPATNQARREMPQLRKLDLQLALETARTLRKDVEDQPSTVQHAALQSLLEIAFLARRQRHGRND